MAKPGDSRKRKASATAPATSTGKPQATASKKPRTTDSTDVETPNTRPLLPAETTAHFSETHRSVVAALSKKYDILPALTISSTKIGKRVVRSANHLRKDTSGKDPRPGVALLYARPTEVCKMITIAEQAKRDLQGDEGGKWFQYNMMYETPPKPETTRDDEIVEEMVPGAGATGDNEDQDDDDGDDSGDDSFEVMQTRSRFERAVVQQPVKRPHMSLSIFLSRIPVPELKARQDVSVQSSEEQTAGRS